MALEVQSPSKDNELLKDGDCLHSPSLIDTDSAKPGIFLCVSYINVLD